MEIGDTMSDTYDFERAWLAEFTRCLDEFAGKEVREQIMAGADELSDDCSRQDVIAWSRRAMERLDSLVDEGDRKAIMAGCACQYPKASLQTIREAYAATGDVDRAHQMLQEQFESFLRDTLRLDEGMVADIVGWGWGAAGVRRGNTIIATKIPKSGYLVEHMQETDPERKRQLYCHCPRIRDVLKTPETLSPTYCACGAGYYQGIWQEILQEPVQVELLESVLQGDDVCKVAIHLPPPD
jgi:hypothetical protein